MNIVCTADYQGLFYDIDPSLIPDGDILLCAGDIGSWGTLQEMKDFNDWLGRLPHRYKCVVVGNHDLDIGRGHDGHEIFTNAIYLQDELVEIEGLRIYGSPISDMNELFHSSPFTAFSAPSYQEQAAAAIPDFLDILITHGPPYGILDQLKNGQSVGSKALCKAVLDKAPLVAVFGHIHESHDQIVIGGTTFINAALCSERNQMFKPDGSLYFDPIVIELEPRTSVL